MCSSENLSEDSGVSCDDSASVVQPEGSKVARATGLISVFTLLSRILGLIRDAVIAFCFDPGVHTDAFYVAFRIPNLLRRLVAEGSMATAFVPVLSDELNDGKSNAHKAIAAVTTCSIAITIPICLIGMIWAQEIIWFFAVGFGHESEKARLSASLLRILFPYVAIIGLVSITASALNTIGKFALPALAPAILNVCMISFALFATFANPHSQTIHALAWAVLTGGLIALVVQNIQLSRNGYGLYFGNPFGHPAVKKLLYLMLPAIVSASAYQFLIFINTLLASTLESGSVSWLYYADRLFQFPLGVFTLALATAVMPTLSRYASSGNEEGIRRYLQLTLGWVTYVTIPAAVGLAILANPIIDALLVWGGQFTTFHAEQSARALVAYSIGLWPISCQSILVRCYLSKKQATFPAIVTTIGIIFNCFLAFALMGKPLHFDDTWFSNFIINMVQTLSVVSLGHVGLALAASISSYLTLFLLLIPLKRIGTSLCIKTCVFSLIRAIAATSVMALIINAINLSLSSSVATILVAIPAGVVVYLLVSFALGSPEVRQLANYKRFFCAQQK